MTQQKKLWVFTELVKDPDNIEQLLSYAIYKGFKDEIARNARNDNKTEEKIETLLSNYHDHCLQSAKQLEVFRTAARNILNGYVAGVNAELESRLSIIFSQQEAEKQKEIVVLNKKLKNSEKEALEKFMTGAQEYSKQIKKSAGWAFLGSCLWSLTKFLFSGVPKLVATAFSLGVLFAIYASFSSDATTALRKGIYKTVDTFIPPHYDGRETK